MALKRGTATLGHCLPAPSDSPVGALENGAGISASWPASSQHRVFTVQITFHHFILDITLRLELPLQLHFTGEGTEAQGITVICPRSYSF